MPKKVFRDSDSEEEDPIVDGDQEEEDVKDDSGSGGSDLASEDEASGSDSDDAPDDVSFSRSKIAALQKVKDAMKSIGEEKDRQKQKRRLRDDQFKEQKKQRLNALVASRLPDDVLDSISAAPISKPKKVEIEEEQTEEREVDLPAELEDEDCMPDDSSEADDFIPLGDSKVKAVYIKDVVPSVDKVAAFKSKQLYGGKLRRHSEKSRRSLSAKRKARFR